MQNATSLLERYRNFTQQNQSLVPHFETIPLPEQQNRFQYVGGQFIGDTLYSVVNSACKMLSFCATDRTMHFSGEFPADDFKWTGGCVFQEIFYSFPRLSDSLLAYFPTQKRWKQIPSGFSYAEEHHYGGVCTETGIVYQPPRNTDHLLRWNLTDGSCRRIPLFPGKSCRYCGSILHPNGWIYLIPEQGLPVLKLNPETEEWITLDSPDSCLAFNPAIAPDGNIYGFCANRGVLKIDTTTDAVSILFPESEVSAYGTKVGINGKLYSLPGYSNDVWEFDLSHNTLAPCHSVSGNCQVQYAGGAVQENGDIYALPVHADNLLRIAFPDSHTPIPSDLYRAFFCDFY